MSVLHRDNEITQGHWLTPAQVPARVSVQALHEQVFALPPGLSEEFLGPKGQQVRVLRQGEDRPVILVHGLGHDCWDWFPLFNRRPEGHALLALDLPGFGRSHKNADPGIMDRMVSAIIELAQAQQGPVALIGSSLGAHLCLLAALKKPELFAGLMVVSPGGLYLPPRPLQRMAQATYSFETLCNRSDDDVVRGSRRIFANGQPKREELAARKVAIHRSPLAPTYAAPFARVVAEVFEHSVGHQIGDLDLPLAMVCGDRDVIVPVPLVRPFATKHNIPFHLLHEVGHLPMVEAPERFAALVTDFLSQLSFAAD